MRTITEKNSSSKPTSSALGESTLAARKATVSELLAQDRQKLLMKLPFTGSLVMRLDLVPVSDVRLETASTDGDRIFVDVDFYSKLDAAERLFVLAHEVWHCALLHFLRRGDRDPKRFNIAADLEIHFLLTDEGLEAPFVLPHDPRWKGLSAEEIYERLGKPLRSSPFSGGRKNDSGEGKESEHIKGATSFDRHLERAGKAGYANDDAGEAGNDDRAGRANDGAADGGNDDRADGANEGDRQTVRPSDRQTNEKGRDPDYSPVIAPGVEERCRERLTSAAQQYERMKGKLPAGLKAIVQAILKPEISWKELLAQFVTSCYGGSRRWLPPARRHVWQGLYLQSQRSERLRAVVAIDTSGSTQGDRPKFLRLVRAHGDPVRRRGGPRGDLRRRRADRSAPRMGDDRRRGHGLPTRLPLHRRASRTRPEPAHLLHGRLRRLPRPRPGLPRDVAPRGGRNVPCRMGNAGETMKERTCNHVASMSHHFANCGT